MLNEQKIYQTAIYKCGSRNQILKTVEELAELSQALIKFTLYNEKINIDNIYEEIADVEIMISQLKIIFHNNKAINKFKLFKLNRLKYFLKKIGGE